MKQCSLHARDDFTDLMSLCFSSKESWRKDIAVLDKDYKEADIEIATKTSSR